MKPLGLIAFIVVIGCSTTNPHPVGELVDHLGNSMIKRMKEHEENEKLKLTDSKEIDKYGIKLTMSYDKETNTFVGTVRNYSTITQKIQIAVRMYVDDKRDPRVWRRLKLKSREKVELELKGVSEKFEYWRLTLYFRE